MGGWGGAKRLHKIFNRYNGAAQMGLTKGRREGTHDQILPPQQTCTHDHENKYFKTNNGHPGGGKSSFFKTNQKAEMIHHDQSLN